MSNNVHGHEVMQMMMASGRAFKREELRAAIEEKYGADARFFTCSADGMTADELIEFLDVRGKFVDTDGALSTDPDKICNHD